MQAVSFRTEWIELLICKVLCIISDNLLKNIKSVYQNDIIFVTKFFKTNLFKVGYEASYSNSYNNSQPLISGNSYFKQGLREEKEAILIC